MIPLLAPVLRALVLDGDDDHALAAVRGLGRRGVQVTVASHESHALGFASRHCMHRIVAPAPALEAAKYADWLLETLRRGRYDATLCCEEATAEILSRHRERVQKWTGCPMPPHEIYLAADRKDRVTRLANQLGVPVPITYELQRLEDAAALAETLAFPVVVKAVQGAGGSRTELVREPANLTEAVRRIAARRRDATLPLPIVQEHIEGRAYGLTALMRRGEMVASFMHRRIGEPGAARRLRLFHGAAGAVSVDEPELQRAGGTLLQALCWDGIATVEFLRRQRDGRFYLMELNPHFSRALDLAVAAGVDLPWLYLQLAAGRPVVGPNRYRVGLRYYWLAAQTPAEGFANPLRSVVGALSALRPDARCDLSLRDPLPHLTRLRRAMDGARDRRRAAPPLGPGRAPQSARTERPGNVPDSAPATFDAAGRELATRRS